MPKKGEKRGPYRKKHERPNPDLSPSAEENRINKKFNSRLPQPLIDRLSEAWKHTEYNSRNEWLENVLTEAVEKVEKSLDADG